MLRVREPVRERKLPGDPFPGDLLPGNPRPRSGRSRNLRLLALTLAGLSLGAGGAVVTVSFVQAGDDAGIREFHLQEHYRRQRATGAAAVYTSTGATAYAPAAPARGGLFQPFFQAPPGAPLPQPVVLNPFRKQTAAPAKKKQARQKTVTLNTVSGAADVARTICVRMCDGYQAPLGYLRANSDLKAHDALCKAMNPGVPVKVFKVAAGADTIDDAQAADGTRYGRLPVAFSYQTSADAACRPAIVQEGERRISLLRDITLRPGDSVVLDGKVRTFSGSKRWPYSTADFRDFRSSAEISRSSRREIDQRVGISRLEESTRAMRRKLQLNRRQASLNDRLSDATFVLRGPIDENARGPVRLIPLGAPQR